MDWADEQRRGSIWAAYAFALAGPVALVGSVANASSYAEQGGNATAIVVAGVSAIVIAVLIPFVPWSRLGRRSTLVLPLLAVGVIVAAEIGSKSSRTADGAMSTGTLLTLVFVWIGLTQRRFWSLGAMPFVTVAVALAFTVEGAKVSVATIAMTVGLGALVGELVAWVKHADRERTDELGVVIDGAGELRNETDRQAAAERIAATVVALLHVPNAAVYLRDASDRMMLASVVGSLVWDAERTEVPDGLAVRPVAHGLELAIPLVGRRGRSHGLVVAVGRRRQDEFMLRLAQVLGEQAGHRLGDLAELETLTDETRRDALTGVGNRRHADELLDELRAGDVVAVADLDDLRGINARYGHFGGDDVIQAVARYLRDTVRQTDAVARLGGDEFLVVLHHVGTAAFPLIERIADDWNAANPDATFSVGAAVHESDDPEATLRAADEALFAAKDLGKARAYVVTGETVTSVSEAVGS